jgi:hypothetical protein
MTRRDAYDRMRNVRRELDASLFALAHAIRLVNHDVRTLEDAGKGGTSPSELVRCRDNLEINYIMRLFSEFEAAIRSFWMNTVRNSRPGMEVLMDRIADRVNMSATDRASAQAIRGGFTPSPPARWYWYKCRLPRRSSGKSPRFPWRLNRNFRAGPWRQTGRRGRRSLWR